jgi:hypothetical protein
MNTFFICVTVFIFSISLSIGENILTNIKILFSYDYGSRAFYSTTKIVYSARFPLHTIDDYRLYAKSLRNYEEFYANVAWFPSKGYKFHEEYVVVEHKSQMQDYKDYVLFRTIKLDDEINNRVFGCYYKKITKREFPLGLCYLYKKLKQKVTS